MVAATPPIQSMTTRVLLAGMAISADIRILKIRIKPVDRSFSGFIHSIKESRKQKK